MKAMPGLFAVTLIALTGNALANEDWVTLTGEGIVAARYDVAADVYPHRIMGSLREKLVLAARDHSGKLHTIDLRDVGDNVFEDISPRVVDADGNGKNDIVVVESDPRAGAQLAIYSLVAGELIKKASTPHIGTRFRWLAPVAIADLDGNGVMDFAYVDRPHLSKTLRVWSWSSGGLKQVAELPGLTNHRIGDEVIWGGLRDCGDGPEMALANAQFNRIVYVRLTDSGLQRKDAGPAATPEGFDDALNCF